MTDPDTTNETPPVSSSLPADSHSADSNGLHASHQPSRTDNVKPTQNIPPMSAGAMVRSKAKPIWPNVIGIAACIISALTLLNALGGLMGSVMMGGMFQTFIANTNAGSTETDFIVDLFDKIRPVILTISVARVLTSLLFLTTGILLLTRSRLARRTCFAYIGAQSLSAIVIASVSAWGCSTIIPIVLKEVAKQQPNTMTPLNSTGMATGIATFVFAISMFMFTLLPIFLVIWMNLKSVRTEMATWNVATDEK